MYVAYSLCPLLLECVLMCAFMYKCVSAVFFPVCHGSGLALVRKPFGNNSALIIGNPLFLGTGCPSFNMITVTTVAISVDTELQVNKGERQ